MGYIKDLNSPFLLSEAFNCNRLKNQNAEMITTAQD